jgi:hypothetical protein
MRGVKLMGMKRLILAALILLAGWPALAFNPTPARGDRIGILRSIYEEEEGTAYAASLVRTYLRRELDKRGFDAFDVRGTLDDVRRSGDSKANYYVELIGDAESEPHGGIGVYDRHVAVDMAMYTSRISVRMTLYDGETLEPIESFDLERETRAIRPSAVGVGGRHVGLWLPMPFAWRFRPAAKALALDAANAIAGTSEP